MPFTYNIIPMSNRSILCVLIILFAFRYYSNFPIEPSASSKDDKIEAKMTSYDYIMVNLLFAVYNAFYADVDGRQYKHRKQIVLIGLRLFVFNCCFCCNGK